MAIAVVAALGLRAVSGLPLWACLLVVVGSMVVNGFVADWEDRQPGGFHGPDREADRERRGRRR
jgi:hypothetical protein